MDPEFITLPDDVERLQKQLLEKEKRIQELILENLSLKNLVPCDSIEELDVELDENAETIELKHFEGELDEEDDGEEEEVMPEEFTSLSPDEQQSAIKRKAFTMLLVGTALVLLFSDPMVEVLSEVAKRANIPAFYVSFILAPLASNASEVIASQYYAAKKTRRTITVALTALEGAASMNNSFCLAIFMALIYFRGLAWQFSAETISIVLVQFVIGALALKGHMSAFTGMIVLAMFPLSVVFVATLEFFGMD
jgi:Ca2+/H+ antiporter